ncbi:CvpA family protein [Bacillus sp. N9]
MRRGFILQLLHMIGFIIAFIVAHMYYEELAPKLRLWIPYPSPDGDGAIKMLFDSANMDEVFYRAIAFVIIFFAVRVVLGIIGSALDVVASLPVLKTLNIWAGGLLGFIEIYLLVFIVLYIAALLPIPSVQTAVNQSFIAIAMLEHTPYFSTEVTKWWVDYVQK